MKNSKALLLDYLASVRDPERAASLFADDGVFELPFLRSLGVEPRYTGRREITALVHKLLEIYPNFAFAPDDTRILIETPEKTFAEYVGARARRCDRANGPSSVHRVPGGRGWQDQVAARILQSADDGAGAIAEWCSRHRTTRRRGALFLIERETSCAEPSMQPGPQEGLFLLSTDLCSFGEQQGIKT